MTPVDFILLDWILITIKYKENQLLCVSLCVFTSVFWWDRVFVRLVAFLSRTPHVSVCRISFLLAAWLTVIWLSPANRMVRVGDMKYLKARSRLSLSKHSALSSGSFTVLHIRSAMLRAALWRSSWSDSLHRYLQAAKSVQSCLST